jgi:hypothetical protein
VAVTDSQGAALQMLARSPGGYALLTMTARGVAIEVLQDLVRMGLATAQQSSRGRGTTARAPRGESHGAGLPKLQLRFFTVFTPAMPGA